MIGRDAPQATLKEAPGGAALDIARVACAGFLPRVFRGKEVGAVKIFTSISPCGPRRPPDSSLSVYYYTSSLGFLAGLG